MLSHHQYEDIKSVIKTVFKPSAYVKLAKDPSRIIRILDPFFDIKLRQTPAQELLSILEESIFQLDSISGQKLSQLPISIDQFLDQSGLKDYCDNQVVENFGSILESYGSDKSTTHNYYLVYQPILSYLLNISPSPLTLEIGLGTNNIKFKSNMGRLGSPGASVRAFRDFDPRLTVYGADIDSQILFQEERIKTDWVDQLKLDSLETLFTKIGQPLDLIIDDGLHNFEANLKTLNIARNYIKIGGWIVIEDIGVKPLAQSLWNIVKLLLKDDFNSYLIMTQTTYMFLAKRIQ